MVRGRAQNSSRPLVALAFLLLVALGLLAAPEMAPAAKCLHCGPPPEEPKEPPEELPPPSTPKMLVINVGWENGEAATSAPLSATTLSNAAAYLRNNVNSWFKAAAPTAFHPWAVFAAGSYSIPAPPTAGCSGLALGREAFVQSIFASGEAEARAHNFDLSAYDVVVFVWSRKMCVFDGITNGLRGNRIALDGSMVSAIHELGHHMGLPHADALVCRNADGSPAPALTGSCHVSESGDSFDTMAGRLIGLSVSTYEGMFNSIFENALGWLPNQVAFATAGDYTQSWTLKPLSEVGASPRALRLLDGSTTLWIEYRQPTGLDTQQYPGLTYGLLIHREVSNGAGRVPSSQLLDMSPGTSIDDPGLQVGQTWSNPLGEMKITLNSAGPAGATVTISSQRVTVPEVVGKPLAQAEEMIRAAGLTPTGGGNVNDPTCTHIGVVASQSPFGGNRVLPGSAVNLAVGVRDPDHECQ